MTKNVIELNGQKYDALTGRPVTVTTAKPAPAAKKHATTGPKHLDGFSRRPGAPRQTTTQSVHSKTTKSQTLMRSAVKQPVATPKVHAKVAHNKPANHQKAAPPPIVGSEKPGRVIRATTIAQNSLITKFGKTSPTINTAEIEVKPAPVVHQAPTPPSPHLESVLKAAPVTKSSAPAHASVPKAKDPFHSAIENAISHNQPKLKKAPAHHRVAKRLHVSPKFVTFVGATVAVFSVLGVMAYQNMPEIALKVASTRSGLNASLPAYQPAGFAITGPIKYNPGEVTINYKSNSDDRGFNVVQKNSSWNSETLLENFVTTSNQPYQTFQANGRTIYIYEGNKATWVDGGVWFNIDGKTNLNSDQLLRIANSL